MCWLSAYHWLHVLQNGFGMDKTIIAMNDLRNGCPHKNTFKFFFFSGSPRIIVVDAVARIEFYIYFYYYDFVAVFFFLPTRINKPNTHNIFIAQFCVISSNGMDGEQSGLYICCSLLRVFCIHLSPHRIPFGSSRVIWVITRIIWFVFRIFVFCFVFVVHLWWAWSIHWVNAISLRANQSTYLNCTLCCGVIRMRSSGVFFFLFFFLFRSGVLHDSCVLNCSHVTMKMVA